ncbi:MAG: type II CAAX endopeptidase family protein [Candidatus Izemoplasmatales bacterium]|nr:type II CAAX endopeptidase family protein [Candidatus Izemoplasmatales bacterium]
MNEYSDLFEKKPQQPSFSPSNPQKEMESFEDIVKSRINHTWIIILYFASMFLVVALLLGFYNIAYPNEDATLAGLLDSQEIELVLSESDNPEYPYMAVLHTSFTNTSNQVIDNFIFEIEFLQTSEVSLGRFNISKVDFQIDETWVKETTFYFNEMPDSYATSRSLDLKNDFKILINVLQMILLSIIFIAIDWKSLLQAFKKYAKNLSYYIGQTFLGFGAVYLALIFSNLLLTTLGVTETSENELAIRSLFQSDIQVIIMLFILLCIVTPIVEEFVFRKVLFGFIEPKYGAIVAIIGSGIIFAFMHVLSGDFIQIIPYALMGIVFGYFYYKTRNLFVTIGMHFLNNFLVFLIYVLSMFITL